MKIDAMMRREDFFEILRQTVEKYYREVWGKEGQLAYSPLPNSQKLVVNGKLNFISPTPVPPGVKIYLAGEYNLRGSGLKHLAGKAVVQAGSRLPWLGRVRTAYLTRGLLGNNAFICPQNRSIRIFDYDAMTVDCMVKQGFTHRYFDNQAAFRQAYAYPFVLPMLCRGEDWFREPILLGHPLARVTDPADYRRGMEAAFAGMEQLARDTAQQTPPGNYAAALKDKLLSLLEQAEMRKHIRRRAALAELVERCVRHILRQRLPVTTVMSHGDLQTGNIWLDEEKKTWVYDWETAGRRSIWYDSAVLGCRLRRADGWREFLRPEQYGAMLRLDTNRDYTADERQAIKELVLLEDIAFYLEDLLELPRDWGTEIFEGFCDRILPLFAGREEEP